MAMGYHLQAKQKSSTSSIHPPWGCYWPWSLTLSPLSISKIISRLQVRQKTWMLLPAVSGRTRINLVLRAQHGHETHPFFTTSLPRSLYAIKPFSLHLDPVRKYSSGFKYKKSFI